jgi:AcrR family transcriptional regulator
MPAPAQTSTKAIVAAARLLLEERGADALTMRDVAAAVGVRAPSLYKRVRDRTDLVRLILESVTDELAAALNAAAGSGEPVADLKAMAYAYRAFAHANPAAWALLNGPQTQSIPGSYQRSARSAEPVMRAIVFVAGERDALPAARTLVPWVQGFITMELAGAFHLGGDVADAWEFGLTRLLAAIRRPEGSSS